MLQSVRKSWHSGADCRTGMLHGLRFSMSSANLKVLHLEDKRYVFLVVSLSPVNAIVYVN